MLTAYDENFCHQTTTTFDHVSDTSEYWRENQWACLYDETGEIFISAVFGVSPNRNVMDGSAQLTLNGKTQYTVRASRELRPNNADITVGPLAYEVIEGLHSVRWVLGENDQGISWDIVFESTMPPREEQPQFARSRGRVTENMCRWAQTGRVKGWVKVEGKTYQITPDKWIGHRDRSWGVRWHPNFNYAEAQLQPPEPFRGLTFDWNTFQFKDWWLLSQRRELFNGQRAHFSGGITYAYDLNKPATNLIDEKVEFELEPGTKQLKRGRIIYTTDMRDEIVIDFKVITTIYIHAAGYWPYKGFKLGAWMGENWTDSEKVDITDPAVVQTMEEAPLFMVECTCGDDTSTGMIQFGVHGNHYMYWPEGSDEKRSQAQGKA